jgi:hypothetical protein
MLLHHKCVSIATQHAQVREHAVAQVRTFGELLRNARWHQSGVGMHHVGGEVTTQEPCDRFCHASWLKTAR